MIMIETSRLFLREMGPEDFDALYAVLADSDIMQHYPYTFDEARVRNWINKNIERYRVFGFGLWAFCLQSSGEMIGDCGLTMQRIGGTIMLKWVGIFLLIGLALELLRWKLAAAIAFGFSGALFLLLLILLAIEAHQDRVLNEIAAQEHRDTD